MDAYKTGQFIKKLRTERNLSQYQLADLVPITRQAVSKWERGVSLPDSSTLLILAKIFDVTIDELLIGERKDKNIHDKLKEVTLKMVDENISKSKKIKRILIINTFILIIFALLFFLYYFINSYNSIKFYTVNGKGEKFVENKGMLIITKQKIYFESGKINYNNEKIKVNEIKLYYTTKNKNKLIYSVKDNDFLIIDFYGYNLYFKYDNIDDLIKNLYLVINYNDNKEEKIHLNIKNYFSNDNIFSKLSKPLISTKINNVKGLLKENNELKNEVTTKNNNVSIKTKENFSKNENKLEENKTIEVLSESENENKVEKEYEKVLMYLENKDLLIKMIKKNFILNRDEYNPTYSKNYTKDNTNISLSYAEKSNFLNIDINSGTKSYECYWILEYDMINISFFEDGNLINEQYITKNDIDNKNEKYQLLADIIFDYLSIFLN